MSKRFVGTTFLSLIVLFFMALTVVPPAGAKSGLPEPMATEFPLYPGAKVIKARSNPGGSHGAQVNFGKTPIPKLFKFYQAKLVENGYTIIHALQGQSLIAEKPNMQAVINLSKKKGATMAMMALEVKKSRPVAAKPKPKAKPKKKPKEKANMAGLLGGKTKYPPKLAAVVPLFPDSLVMYSKSIPTGVSIMATIKDHPAADVVDFYKTKITKKGWQKAYDETNAGNTVLGFKKDNQEITAIVRDAGEALIVTLSIEEK